MILKNAINDPKLSSVFGSIEVIDQIDSVFSLRCSCGRSFTLSHKYKVTEDSDIRCKFCKRRDQIEPDVGERAAYNRVKSDAARGNREFQIPFEWFKHAVHAPCHYCGRIDQNSISVSSKIEGEYLIKNFRYNGLDRLNNDLGYVIQNCIPCCVVCNRAKNSMVYQDFIEWISDMIQYRSSQ